MKSMLKSLMSVAAAALALTSCSTDATEEVILKGERRTLEVNASIEQTRTSLAADHIDLEWSENDEILLYIGETAAKADAKKIKPKAGGTITGVTYNEGDMVYANYSLDNEQYSEGVKMAEIKIDHKQEQSEANVFAGENLPMVAKGIIDNGKVNLTFKPVGCVLVFNVYNQSETLNIKSIAFETSVGCCGYDNCDLTAETLVYEPYKDNTSAKVTLATSAATGISKPTNTQKGENQIYLVVAPVNYPAGSKFIVTTDAGETFTFETKNGIDCSQSTARVVNLNLANAPEMQPSIEVPTVPQQLSEGGDLTIEGIVFKHIAAEELNNVEVGVYNDEALTQPLDPTTGWLTIEGNSTTIVESRSVVCHIAANDGAERTAYIGFKYGETVKAAIAITQVAKGASADKYFVKVTSNLEDWTGDYLIVYEDETQARALNGSLSKIDAANNYKEVTITEQGILSDDTTNALLVKISKIDGGYILQAAHGQYLYSSSNANQLKESTDYTTVAKAPNSISIDSGSAKIESKGSVLRFNSSSNQMRFRYFKSTTYTNQKAVQLYKLQ